eukprot:m.157106 g.157106  ORF g.157106 m.157106 type:complete len:421 (+) comp15108_c0_seq3:2-1264(+)
MAESAGVLDENTTSVPVVGRNIVVGPKKYHTTKRIERPPHKIAPASWHLDPKLDLPGPLPKEKVQSFFEDGYLFLPNHFGSEILDDVRKDVEGMISNLAQRLYNNGKIKDLYEGLDWTSRLLRMRQDFPDAPVILIKGGVLPPALQKLFCDQEILDIAQQLGVGPDVALNPAWNLRGKMPSHEETVVPWHQDNSYWEPRIWDEVVLTVWVALVDATVENGCLQMVKGGHKAGKTASHTIGTTTTTWYTEVSEETIAKELLGKAELEDGVDKITFEAKAGSILIFPGTTPHRSINSTSKNIRWSVDYRLHCRVPKRRGKSDLDWFYGLKDSILLRKDDDKDFVPDFSEWANVDRTEMQENNKGLNATEVKENFDPVVIGPWMDLWDLEEDTRGRPNKHVDKYLQTDPSARNVDAYIEKGNW